MKRIALVVLAGAASLLYGCATSSDALMVGPDTYTISARASVVRGGASGARVMALTEAGQFCAGQGKQVLVTNESQQGSTGTRGSADVTFRCLAKGDPDLVRPTYRAAPSVVIEDRRQ